jgi:hypothetical protein
LRQAVHFANRINKTNYDRLRFDAEIHGMKLKGGNPSQDDLKFDETEKKQAASALKDAQKRVQARIKKRAKK